MLAPQVMNAIIKGSDPVGETHRIGAVDVRQRELPDLKSARDAGRYAIEKLGGDPAEWVCLERKGSKSFHATMMYKKAPALNLTPLFDQQGEPRGFYARYRGGGIKKQGGYPCGIVNVQVKSLEPETEDNHVKLDLIRTAHEEKDAVRHLVGKKALREIEKRFVQAISQTFPKRKVPPELEADFKAGKIFIKHPLNQVIAFHSCIVAAVAAAEGSQDEYVQWVRDDWHDIAIARSLNSRSSPLQALVSRIRNFDKSGREWASDEFACRPPEEAISLRAAMTKLKEKKG